MCQHSRFSLHPCEAPIRACARLHSHALPMFDSASLDSCSASSDPSYPPLRDHHDTYTHSEPTKQPTACRLHSRLLALSGSASCMDSCSASASSGSISSPISASGAACAAGAGAPGAAGVPAGAGGAGVAGVAAGLVSTCQTTRNQVSVTVGDDVCTHGSHMHTWTKLMHASVCSMQAHTRKQVSDTHAGVGLALRTE